MSRHRNNDTPDELERAVHYQIVVAGQDVPFQGTDLEEIGNYIKTFKRKAVILDFGNQYPSVQPIGWSQVQTLQRPQARRIDMNTIEDMTRSIEIIAQRMKNGLLLISKNKTLNQKHYDMIIEHTEGKGVDISCHKNILVELTPTEKKRFNIYRIHAQPEIVVNREYFAVVDMVFRGENRSFHIHLAQVAANINYADTQQFIEDNVDSPNELDMDSLDKALGYCLWYDPVKNKIIGMKEEMYQQIFAETFTEISGENAEPGLIDKARKQLFS